MFQRSRSGEKEEDDEDGRLLILHQHFVTLVSVPSPLYFFFLNFFFFNLSFAMH